jgi:poly-gamma-glutamate synthesis protein (capsule biosynthesis protein)
MHRRCSPFGVPLILFAVIAAIFSAAFSGCRTETENTPPRAEVILEAGLESAWGETLAAHPPPEGIDLLFLAGADEASPPAEQRAADGSAPEASERNRDGAPDGTAPEARIVVSRTGYGSWNEVVGLARKEGSAVLGITAYVPVTDLLDSAFDTSTADAAAGVYPLKAYGSVRLPEKGLSVDGRYPGDPEYPLYRGVLATIRPYLGDASDESGGVGSGEVAEGTGTEKGSESGDPGTSEKLRRWLEAVPLPSPPAPPVWTAGVGDIMPGRGVDWTLTGFDDGIERIFSDTLPLLRGADITLGNLETVISRAGERIAKSYNFRSPPEVLGPLREAGFDYLSLTNNHCFDYGPEGFLDTLEALDAAGILTSGAGKDEAEARKPVELNRGGTPLRILSVGAYPREANGFDGSRTARATEEGAGILWADSPVTAAEILREVCSPESFDIVMVHGGYEWQSLPSPDQAALYRSFVDSGADLVLGSHPHVLQPLEAYRGGLIAFSLGNFIFPGMGETLYGEESMILRVGITGTNIGYVEVHPVRIRGRFIGLDRTDTIKKRFFALSRNRF